MLRLAPRAFTALRLRASQTTRLLAAPIHWWRGWVRPRTHRHRAARLTYLRQRRSFRPGLESLEARELLSSTLGLPEFSALQSDLMQLRNDMTASSAVLVKAVQPSSTNTPTAASIQSLWSNTWSVLTADWSKTYQAFVQLENDAWEGMEQQFDALLHGLITQPGIPSQSQPVSALNSNGLNQPSPPARGLTDTAAASGPSSKLLVPMTTSGGDASQGSVMQDASLPSSPSYSRTASSTSLISLANPSTPNQLVDFTATVTPVPSGGATPTGTVTFYDNATEIGTESLDANGRATLSYSSLASGSHDVEALYNGDSTYAESMASLVQTVSSSSVVVGNGTIGNTFSNSIFSQGPATLIQINLGNTISGGLVTSFNLTNETIYNGGSGSMTVSGMCDIGTNNQNTSHFNIGGPLSYTINGSFISGTFSFSGTTGDGTNRLVSGNGSFSGTLNGSGTCSGTIALSVSPVSFTKLTSSASPSQVGQSVTLTASVTGNTSTPTTGTFTFYDGTTLLGSGTLNNGVATYATSNLAVGVHNLLAVYNGDSSYPGSVANLTQVVNENPGAPTSTTLTSSVDPALAGLSIALTATVAPVPPGIGTPTGTVIFTDGSTQLGTATVQNGTATLNLPLGLAENLHYLQAAYQGDSNFAGSQGNLNLRVTDAPVDTTEGQSFSGAVVSFTDPDGNIDPAKYNLVTINWGDKQTSAGTVNALSAPGQFQVMGTHDYTEEGSPRITVTITDADGDTFSPSNDAVIQDAQLTGTNAGPLQANQGAAFQATLGSFTDADPNGVVGDYRATIDWGDGSTSLGTISGSGPFTVTGDHTYLQTGPFTVKVSVLDQGGAKTILQDDVTVSAPALPYTPGSPSFVEGAAPASQPLATFTDSSNIDPANYRVDNIDWGDGTSSSLASITYLGNNTFQISGTHGYSEESSPKITITLTDLLTDSSETIPVTATVTDASLTPRPLGLTAYAGVFYSNFVARFNDANPNARNSDFTATINWGDGSTPVQDTGVIVPAPGGGWQVDGGHTYTTVGTYYPTVTITDDGGQTTTVVSTMNVLAARQTLTFSNLSFTEGQAFNGTVATYTPPSGSSGSYQAIIRWGDGTRSDVTLAPNGSGGYSVIGSHTYTEENLPDQPLTITVTETPAPGTTGGWAMSGEAQVTVADAPLTPTSMSLSGWANTPLGNVVVGKFSDANPQGSKSDFTTSIDWGDNSTATTGTLQVDPQGGFDVLGNHTYAAAGTYTVVITVTDDGGQSTTINSTVSITAASTSASLTATEGSSFSGVVATFSGDVSDASSASITWGDGTQSSGTIAGDSSSFTVSGTHTYSDEGSYPLSVTVQMSPSGTLTAAGAATVQDAALTASGVNLSTTLGQALQQVVLATFSDANPNAILSDFSASINWGDGEVTSDTVQQNGSAWQVLGSHTYAEASNYTAIVTITDVGGSTATADSTITTDLVEGQDYPLQLQVAAPAGSGQSASAGTTYTAMIDWGDGSDETLGTVSEVSGSSPLQLMVSGNHVYSEEGNYTIRVTVNDPDGNQSSASTSLTVTDAPLDGYGLNLEGTAGTNTGDVTLGSFTDQNNAALASDFTNGISIDWGDGSGTDTTTGQVSSLSGGDFQVTGNHTYTTAGTYTVTTTITDDGGQSTTVTGTATIASAWSIIAAPTGQRFNDPNNAQLVPIGEASVDLNQGGLRLSHALDFDLSPGTSIGRDPALVYNSSTVDVRPTIQMAVQGDPTATAPTSAQVQLTWNHVAQTPVNYQLTQPAGSIYLFSVQPDSYVTGSGAYDWSATVTFTIPGSNDQVVSTSGTAYVVARDSSAYGAGWGIDGISQLVVSTAGALRINGQGDSTFFASNGSGGFDPPPDDFGTLAQNLDGSYTYTAVDRTKFNYNSAGYLTSVVDTHNLSTTYLYDSLNRLIQVTAIDGGVTTLTYDATTGLLDTITEPGNRVLSLLHDGSGNLTQITDVDTTTRTFSYANPSNHLLTEDQWAPLDATFSYDSSNLLTQVNLGLGSVYTIVPAAADQQATDAAWASITDGDNHTTQYLLDLQGRLLEQIEPDGTSTYQYLLNAAGLPVVSVDPLGRTTLDSYDAYGDVLQETEADGSWTRYTYDPTFHEVTSTLNSLGESSSNTYDATTGDVLTSTDALGATTTYAYYHTTALNGLVYTVTTPTQSGTATSFYSYDAERRVIVRVDNLDVQTLYTYDSYGNPSTTTDPYGRATKTVYSPRGLLLQSIDPMQGVTSYSYNAYGEETSVTDANGSTATTSYDQRGWVTAQTDNLGVTTEADQYDAAGNLLKQTDGNGNATQYAYNADDELTQTTYADGTTSGQNYDADGEVTSSTDPLGRTTSYVYNPMGEEVSSTDPMGRSSYTLYDAAGNDIADIDPLGLATLNYYNADNEEIGTSRQVSSGAWSTTQTLYDLAGEVVGSVDALGHTASAIYNADGEEVSSTDADGNTFTNVYDQVGNLIQSTDARGKTINYYYNADNEPVATLDADGNLTQTIYDADGNVVQVIDSKGTTTTTYDGDGRVLSVTDADGNVSQNVYDNDGNVIESIDPNLYSARRQYNSAHIKDLSSGKSGVASQANPALKRPAPVDAPPAGAFSAWWAGRTELPVFPPATPHAAMPYACPDAKDAAARCPTDWRCGPPTLPPSSARPMLPPHCTSTGSC